MGSKKLTHEEGFEKEAKFHMVLEQAANDCWIIKAHTVRMIIAHFAPDAIEELHKIRPCVRRLKYLGHCRHEDTSFCGEAPHGFFKVGKIYESIDFNGATYTIKGYAKGRRRIGSAYFERIS